MLLFMWKIITMMLRFLRFMLRKLRILACLRAIAMLVAKIWSLFDFVMRKNVKTVIFD